MNVSRYTIEMKSDWDSFVFNSKNGHFLFDRDYMDYHSDKFKDHSLMIHNSSEKLIALLPANRDGKAIYSHQGLTFGGFVVDEKVKTAEVLDIFAAVRDFLRADGFERLIYKCIPYIYHDKPSEEDRYALFINNANLIRRDVTSTIDLREKPRYSKGRKWSINKAKKEGVLVRESDDYDKFWELLEEVLQTNHSAKPVHTLNEIELLSGRFPNNIRLFLAEKEGRVLSGALIYESKYVAHTQYLANSSEGRNVGGLDLTLDYLLTEYSKNKRYFDFGISCEQSGRYLNEGLIAQKEGFGARAVVHDFYELFI
ncbi:GNAT family N-acetyltransferase [Marinobacterium iners]|uniref:Acetyltransferase (GNAT) domain-containing protein n=1 Tax=Marinobacterium iners DSM 11526 TaxID=1122198 RepID=A0A1H4BWB5_9GAMM|nr:GNAT family N-acetyltransferase [Marinobacterium iners]SEA52495.1 Acetyltransferase (GNAT) domain-containing protein [Marinobacterium iners DSM 11526]